MSFFAEVISDPTNRASVNANFSIPTSGPFPTWQIFIGAGSYSLGGVRHDFPGGWISANATAAQSTNPFFQVFLDSTTGIMEIVQVASATSPFPPGSLALCVLVADELGQIRQVIDSRPYPPLS